MRSTSAALAAALVAAFATGCGGAAPSDTDTVLVFAAASLQGTFTELGKVFEAQNPGTEITFNFAGSSDLVAQLTQGAPGDVFASADQVNMGKAVDAGLVAETPVDFASNTLTIVVPPDNPAKIASFADLGREGTRVVVCAPHVPCGAATQRVEAATGVELSPVSEESSVTDVLNKVTAGEADAGLVYVTDAARARDKVAELPFPESRSAVNTYPIAVLNHTGNPETAQKFIDLVTGPQGQSVLEAAGFARP